MKNTLNTFFKENKHIENTNKIMKNTDKHIKTKQSTEKHRKT